MRQRRADQQRDRPSALAASRPLRTRSSHARAGGRRVGLHRPAASSPEEAVSDIAAGYAALVFDGESTALTFEVKSVDKRGVNTPTVEKSVLGAKDAFVESVRVNTALLRRRVGKPSLKLWETMLGSETKTRVDILYIEGEAPPEPGRAHQGAPFPPRYPGGARRRRRGTIPCRNAPRHLSAGDPHRAARPVRARSRAREDRRALRRAADRLSSPRGTAGHAARAGGPGAPRRRRHGARAAAVSGALPLARASGAVRRHRDVPPGDDTI